MEDPGCGQRYSVRTPRNTQERCTQALKLLLATFKWRLDWASLRHRHR